MDNLEEMNTFLKNIQPTKTESWKNRRSEQTINKERDWINNNNNNNKNNLKKKRPGQGCFADEFYQIFTELIPILLKLSKSWRDNTSKLIL